MGLPLYGGPVGEPGGGSFAGIFERNEKYIWAPFLDLEVIKILSLGSFFLDPEDIRIGAIWNFGEGTGLL